MEGAEPSVIVFRGFVWIALFFTACYRFSRIAGC